jgi:hypothetical protein
MKRKTCKSCFVNIWIGGDVATIEQKLREHCMENGLCVTVTPTRYIYTGGQEGGVIVGIRNYPRFPTTRTHLMEVAESIAEKLMLVACQWSCMIEGPGETVWLSQRPDSGEGENG